MKLINVTTKTTYTQRRRLEIQVTTNKDTTRVDIVKTTEEDSITNQIKEKTTKQATEHDNITTQEDTNKHNGREAKIDAIVARVMKNKHIYDNDVRINDLSHLTKQTKKNNNTKKLPNKTENTIETDKDTQTDIRR